MPPPSVECQHSPVPAHSISTVHASSKQLTQSWQAEPLSAWQCSELPCMAIFSLPMPHAGPYWDCAQAPTMITSHSAARMSVEERCGGGSQAHTSSPLILATLHCSHVRLMPNRRCRSDSTTGCEQAMSVRQWADAHGQAVELTQSTM